MESLNSVEKNHGTTKFGGKTIMEPLNSVEKNHGTTKFGRKEIWNR